MKYLSVIPRLFLDLYYKILGFIIPEDRRLNTLLSLDHSTLRGLLPSSPVKVQNLQVLFNYSNQAVKLLIKSIKYKNNFSAKKVLALFMAEELEELISEITLWAGNTPIIMPMPMSKKEIKNRGWNQCEELTKEIQKLIDKNIIFDYNSLKKIRETARQTTLSKEERIENVKNSMSADGSAIRGHSVIIIDDVYTTLSTFREARRALLGAGVKQVFGLFVAH